MPSASPYNPFGLPGTVSTPAGNVTYAGAPGSAQATGPATPVAPAPATPTSSAPVTGTPPPYATSTPGFGSGGGSPAYGTQSPSIFGTGTYTTPLYPINDTAITGQPSQGASTNYGDNSVWSNLSNELAAAPNQGAGMAVSPTANAASYQAATGQAAQAQAAQAGYATSLAAQAQAAQTAAAQGGYALGSPAQAAGSATSQAAQGGYAQAAGVPLSVGGNTIQNQANLASTLNTQATGGGVSPADLQLQQGAEANLATQLAALGSQRGSTNAALAQRSAADAAASSGATLNQQMGIQRAQETLQAQQAENAVLTAQGSQAAGINSTAANLTQQTNLANSAQAQQAILANTQNVEQTALQNAANAQGTTIANLSAAQQTAIENEANAQAATMQNTQNVQAANLANQAASQQASITNADLATQTAQANAANAQQSDIANLTAAQQTALANQAATNSMTGLNLGALNTAAGTNASLAQQTNLANLTAAQQTTLANQQTQLANSTLYDSEINSVLGAQAGISASDKAAALADQQLQVTQLGNAGQTNEQGFAAGAQANANLTGAVIGGVSSLASAGINAAARAGTAPAAPAAGNVTTYVPDTGGSPVTTLSQPVSIPYALSDENLKTGIEGGNPMMQSFLTSYRNATTGDDANLPINVSEGQGFRNPTYVKSAGTPNSGGGGGIGSALLGALGAIGGSFVAPGIGTAVGGTLGSAAGGAIGNAIDPATGGTAAGTRTIPGSGDTINASVTPEPQTLALSDEREKDKVTQAPPGIHPAVWDNLSAELQKKISAQMPYADRPGITSEQAARSLFGGSTDTPEKNALYGELGILPRSPDGLSSEISATVADPRLNGGAPTNIPTLVRGQKDVHGLLTSERVTPEQEDIAIDRAAQRVAAGATLPSYPNMDAAVQASIDRSHDAGRSYGYYDRVASQNMDPSVIQAVYGVPPSSDWTAATDPQKRQAWLDTMGPAPARASAAPPSTWPTLPAQPSPGVTLSDDNEKQAVTSGNRGMQAFLQQANAQTGAQNTSGANNNAFMSSALPPQSQVNTQAPTAGVGPFAAPTAPFIAPNPGAVSAPPFTAQSVSSPGAPQTTGGPTGYGYTPGSSYGGGFANGSGSMGGSIGGGYGGGGFTSGAASGRSSIPGQAPQIPYTTGPSLPAQSAAQASPTLAPYAPPAPTQIAYAPNAPVLDSNRVMPMMVTSDEDEKEKSTDPASVQKMLDQLQAYSYRYKNPNAPGAMPGQRLGVMAQDLEKSKLGASFVRKTEDGTRMVDYGAMAGTQLAASAYLNDRLDQHEAMLKQLTGSGR